MTTGFQNYQNNQPQYQCSQYANNPYVCAYAPASQVVMPQGQVQMPTTIQQPPQVQVLQQPPKDLPNVNYNQVTPYLNLGSPVFQPALTTKSGQTITIAPQQSSVPVNQLESKVVYEGPVKSINPQVTPHEQSDNEIEKQYKNYFKNKAEYNEEFRSALNKAERKKTPWYKKLLGFLCFAGAVYLGCKYRKKIPIIKRFFK